MELREIFGRNVRRARLDRGLSIEALALAADRSYSYVGEIERGIRNPTLSVVEALARSLDVPPHILLGPLNTELPAARHR
ncbi:helix-turn-helix domain-containing protein [Brevundimonas sp.]|jgi:transcriptional regulator with XRE-family HTH domain|uniref:helix-turn-helix domain-containing protein n=1 Tax=Brevundimonas sp. TaxID=1871086 RepID=UPI0037C0D2EB